MFERAKLILTVSMIGLMFAGSALADWAPGDGHKMHFPQLPDPEGLDVNFTTPKFLADDWLCTGTGPVEDPLVTNARHAAALERTAEALDRAAAAGAAGLSEELVIEDLRTAMGHLGEITGELTQEALYDRIFSTFCIGK